MRLASRSSQFSKLFLTALFFCATLLSGCSSGNMQTLPPAGPTKVAVLVTSTANDQLTNFYATIASIQLADSAGNTVPLYINPNPLSSTSGTPEFMRLNGVAEPITTASVPQGVYPTALVNITGCSFTNVSAKSGGGLLTTTYAEGVCEQGSGQATVHLAAPITISGATMALSLNLQVSQSYTISPNAVPPSYSISPTFTLTPFTISSHPANDQNGLETAIDGMVASVNASGNNFSLQTADHVALSIQTDSSTVYQGISSFSGLAAGIFVVMDAEMQSNGSLVATRIEVEDTTAVDVLMGGLLDIGPSPSVANATIIDVFGAQQQGADFDSILAFIQRYQLAANTTFRTSGQFTNIATLPFTASFDPSNLVPGQNIYISSPAISFLAIPTTIATTVTLMPQTINGMVTSVSGSGNFQIYTVALAPNDLLTTLDSTTSVTVYADSSSQDLNSSPIAVGSLLRFHGLLFNDNGTFRMDCAQINDGVTE